MFTMKNLALLYLSMIAIVLPTVSIAQGFYRNLPIGHAMVSSCHASADGGLFAGFLQQSGGPLVHLDAMGEVLWVKSMPGWRSMLPHPDGGLLMLRSTGIVEQPSGEEYQSLLFQRLNADGEMVVNQRILIENGWGDTADWLNAAALTPDGQLYLILYGVFSDPRVLKFDAAGELLWTHQIFVWDDSPTNIQVLPDGGLLLCRLEATPHTLGMAIRLDTDGGMVWARDLRTNAPSLIKNGSSVLLDDDGSLLMAYTANSYDGSDITPWVVVGKMDGEANMLWSYAYRRDPGGSMSNFQTDFDYYSPARFLPNGNLYFGAEKGFEFTPQGLFVREQLCTTPTLAEGFDDITHSFVITPTADGWLQYGIRRWTDPVFGNFIQLPLFGRTLLDLDSTCFWSCTDRTDITAVPPPPEIFSPTVSFGPSQFRSFMTEFLPLETWEDTTFDLLEDACELPEIVEFNTSVNELDAVGRLMLFPNPVMAGQSIQVDVDGPVLLEVLDVRGRSVVSQQLGAHPATLNTAGWNAGLYLLRATRPTGQVLGTKRVVVQ